MEAGVGETGVGELVAVGGRVDFGGGRLVAVGGAAVDDVVGVGAIVVWLITDSGVNWIALAGSIAHACIRSTNKQQTIKVLRTPGVYHNKTQIFED